MSYSHMGYDTMTQPSLSTDTWLLGFRAGGVGVVSSICTEGDRRDCCKPYYVFTFSDKNSLSRFFHSRYSHPAGWWFWGAFGMRV